MHWQAIRRSTVSHEDEGFPAYDGAVSQHETNNIDEESLHNMETGSCILQGQDEAVDCTSDFIPPTVKPTVGIERIKGREDDERSTDGEDGYLQVPIPTFSTGLTTFAYQRAIRNRIRNSKLARHGEYNIRAFTPTFVHDCLMLPGTLANVLGKFSGEQIIHRMTPALLPGFHAHIHSETQEPCLLQSPNAKDFVQGMLIFGQSKEGRNNIHRHYRPYARRVKVQVEVDVLVPDISTESTSPYHSWRFQRKEIWAHAWLWSNVSSVDAQFRAETTGWTLEAYLSGELARGQTMRVESGGKIGEDYEPDSSTDGDEDEPGYYLKRRKPKSKPRRVVYGGFGTLDYIRDDAAIGWW